MTMTYLNRGKITALGNPMIMGLGEIIRYNNRPKIKNENVAEHSFYVSTTVLKICKMYDIDDATKLKALTFAAVHDVPEIFLGDVPYDTKVDNPALQEILSAAELASLEKNMPELSEDYRQFLKEEKEESVAYLITKLADTVSVLQYSNRELQLGNQTQSMKVINDGAVERVSKLIDKLETKLGL
ncbi:YfbR-like 5'-deoxynucleotidase [Priestia aryabhattai]|uniref:YfbR-like 5'-deoxynucleotidase n=1 Tax=Priestia aryabhattai TaxID=412384 RepID=UPI002E23340B|nr:HD domain-containing protein [Priestia aryabhattai]